MEGRPETMFARDDFARRRLSLNSLGRAWPRLIFLSYLFPGWRVYTQRKAERGGERDTLA